MSQTSRRLHDFNYLFERQVLMILRSQCDIASAAEQGGDVGIATKIHAQGQGINETSDQMFNLDVAAVSDRRPDNQILLAR
ncbi:hypothetical protein GCM10011585_32770 [Edaphobacter dinghuensis]|uniref:Uncharacterized protein n=1 Tax=Edaphobacter dinghuensis TaxID=1560005 RepID=A0A917HQJ6_9BACT|nr:hypothetical protein GCM10011585_32770 [Edaphobacter dinghuensis]